MLVMSTSLVTGGSMLALVDEVFRCGVLAYQR